MGMKSNTIRPLAICVFRDGENILVAEGTDDIKGETFYRPLGGAIEFGEYARDTLVREMREEIGAEITDLRYLGALENVFTYMGDPRARGGPRLRWCVRGPVAVRAGADRWQ
ncbi:MAG: NUDIX domain-containing protein [bacterium]